MDNLIQLEQQGPVAILTMNSEQNRHNPDFLAIFNQQLDKIETNAEFKSVVLSSSSDKNWSLGIDVDWMASAQNSPEDIANFMLAVVQLFKRILTFPMPVIAAINGHTYGNGAVLACACDFRLMREDRGFFCFPEVDLSIPFFPSMFPTILKAIPQPLFNRLAMSGQRIDAKILLENQVLEATFESPQALAAGAVKFAQQFDKKRWIYAQNKSQMFTEILTAMDEKDPDFISKISKILWKMMQAR